jgi:hypothetical protein
VEATRRVGQESFFGLARIEIHAAMSIAPFLSKQPFDPETTEAMGVAFDAVCRALGIDTNGVAQPRIVARKIIELAQMGIRDPDDLRARALETFQSGPGAGGNTRGSPSGHPSAK